jgi:outer membrane protein assembly factor BamB
MTPYRDIVEMEVHVLIKSLSKIAFLLLMVVFLLGLTGCGGATTDSWPGLGIDGNTIYVSLGPKVYALDTETGVQQWAFPADATQNEGMIYAPAVQGTDGKVFVGSSSDKVYAFEQPGTEIWSFPTKGAIVGQATVADGTVYVGANDRRIYALSAIDGTEEWSFATDNWNWAAPVYADGDLFVASMDHYVYRLNAKDGREKWRFEANGAVADSPVLADGKLFFGDYDRQVHALNASNGTELWSFKTDHWVWGSPAYYEGTIYVGDLSVRYTH